jgi:hypothetical protein
MDGWVSSKHLQCTPQQDIVLFKFKVIRVLPFKFEFEFVWISLLAKRVLVYAAPFVFKVNRTNNVFGQCWNLISCLWNPVQFTLKTQVCRKQFQAASPILLRSWQWRVSLSTVHGRTRSGLNINVLDRVRSSKKNSIFIFIFNCVLFEKLVFNIIQLHYIN